MQSGVLVFLEIKDDRIDDFLKAMEDDVTKSRVVDYDPGCLRFDLLRQKDAPNKFIFYECYTDDEAAAFHKTTSHYNSWAEFKKSGGVVSQEVVKVENASIPGDWAFQTVASGKKAVGCGTVVFLELKPEHIDEFFKAMAVDAPASRDKTLDPGALRFDLLRNRDDPNKFVFYEAFVDEEALAFHKTTDHYNVWQEFKKNFGVLNQTVVKYETTSMPAWAFQCHPSSCPVVSVGCTSMPLVGFGCYKVGAVPASASSTTDGAPPPPSGPEVCDRILKDALTDGYSMLDCAEFYMNEAWIGNALKQSGVPRDNVYIISKVWNDTIFKGAEAVKQQVDKCIADLQCGYVDLFLVHWPVPGKHVEAFKALCECKQQGKIREVGVSNYCVEDLEELNAAGLGVPAMNQIEVNPLLFRKTTLNYCKEQGIHIQAYRGLLQGPKAWDNAVVQEICKETGKSPPQVLGRFLVQQGISHVPKSSNPERMRENKDLFSFELSGEQMEKLSNLTPASALETFKNLYIKCIWRDTPQAGDPWPSERTLD